MSAKKFLTISLFVGMATFGCLATSSVAFAREPVIMGNLGGIPISCSIYANQVAVNGVHPNDNINTVNRVLGQPWSSTKYGGGVRNYYGGILVTFIPIDPGNPTALDIVARGKGEKTPDGVAIGMPAAVLSDVYGTADSVVTERHVASKLDAVKQEQHAKRLDKTIYEYNANESLTMSFVVRNNVIEEIHIHQSE